ncbi:hypothetical protein B0H11DRAFT_2013041, partial [Mycena galericulata]
TDEKSGSGTRPLPLSVIWIVGLTVVSGTQSPSVVGVAIVSGTRFVDISATSNQSRCDSAIRDRFPPYFFIGSVKWR